MFAGGRAEEGKAGVIKKDAGGKGEMEGEGGMRREDRRRKSEQEAGEAGRAVTRYPEIRVTLSERTCAMALRWSQSNCDTWKQTVPTAAHPRQGRRAPCSYPGGQAVSRTLGAAAPSSSLLPCCTCRKATGPMPLLLG